MYSTSPNQIIHEYYFPQTNGTSSKFSITKSQNPRSSLRAWWEFVFVLVQ